MRIVAFIICALLMNSRLGGWTPERWFERPESDRAAHYNIKGALDWPKKMFEGAMTLTWKNTGNAPVQELPFHLYLNAFRHPGTSFMKANGLVNKDTDSNIRGADAWGYCEIKSASAGGSSLPGRLGEDETVYWISLPSPVNPGNSVQLEIAWEIKFPRIQFGSGWAGSYLVASMWYPRIGAYLGNQWLCAPFSAKAAQRDNYGNFSVFDVELSLPNALQLANTGLVVTPLDESGVPMADKFGRVVEAAYDPSRKLNFIYKIHAEDVCDFSWIAAPQGSWALTTFDFRDRQIFIYHIPKNGTQLERLMEAAWACLRYSEEWLGLYPYPALSIVDLPREAIDAGAASSPMLAIISNIAFDPLQQRAVPEQAVIRQLGEQYFKWAIASGGLDGRAEFAMGATLSAWFAQKVMEHTYPGLITGKRFRVDADFPGWRANGPASKRRCFFPFNLSGYNDKGAPTVAVSQLEAFLGEGVMRDVISAYFNGYSFKRANHDDLRRVAENVSGRDLAGFWENRFEKLRGLDYRIQSVSRAHNGIGNITLKRHSGVIAPITLWVRLEDGFELRQTWDGKDKQITFSFNGPISAAALDPDQNYPSLKNRMKSTYSAKPIRRGLHYWAQLVFGAIGGFLQGIGVG